MQIDELLSLREKMKDSLKTLEEMLLRELSLWQSKATNGFFVEAVMQYREENNCSLCEAKEVVDSFRRMVK